MKPHKVVKSGFERLHQGAHEHPHKHHQHHEADLVSDAKEARDAREAQSKGHTKSLQKMADHQLLSDSEQIYNINIFDGTDANMISSYGKDQGILSQYSKEALTPKSSIS